MHERQKIDTAAAYILPVESPTPSIRSGDLCPDIAGGYGTCWWTSIKTPAPHSNASLRFADISFYNCHGNAKCRQKLRHAPMLPLWQYYSMIVPITQVLYYCCANTESISSLLWQYCCHVSTVLLLWRYYCNDMFRGIGQIVHGSGKGAERTG